MTRELSEPYQIQQTDWEKFKSIRLSSVEDSPQAFGVSMKKIQSYPNSYWCETVKQAQVFVIDDGESYISLAVFSKDDDGVWSIKSLWTDPRYRRLGLATKILNKIILEARDKGLEKIEIGINAKQETATVLFNLLGFRVVKTLPNTDMGDGTTGDLRVMRLRL